MAVEETFEHDNLVASDLDIVTGRETLISGQNLKRGAVLGKITASAKLTQFDSSAGDGSEVPNSILTEDLDASGGDKTATVYKHGEFNENKLRLLTGDDPLADAVKEQLRSVGIFIKTMQEA